MIKRICCNRIGEVFERRQRVCSGALLWLLAVVMIGLTAMAKGNTASVQNIGSDTLVDDILQYRVNSPGSTINNWGCLTYPNCTDNVGPNSTYTVTVTPNFDFSGYQVQLLYLFYFEGNQHRTGWVNVNSANQVLKFTFHTGGMFLVDSKDGVKPPCESGQTSCCGMPAWQVSEPYISLWLHDEPLGYQPVIGSRVSFKIDFKQREDKTGWDPSIFSVGKRWNCSWISYVAQDDNGSNVVHFPDGGQSMFQGRVDYLSNAKLTGNTTTGYTLAYPDGSKNVFGMIVTNSSTAFQEAFLTEIWNTQSQSTRLSYFGYDSVNPVVRLQYIIDGDGRTNSVSYVTTNAYSTNLISQMVDPFGRAVSLAYDNDGHLTNIVDVAGISSSFLYDTNSDCVTNLTTPYGSTGFAITDTTGTNNPPNGRSVLVTQPDSGHQLYLYQDNASGVPGSYSTNQIAVTSPFGNTFDTNNLALRNSFYWGPRQYANLTPTNISAITANQFQGSRMRHWLLSASNTVGDTLSFVRQPSPDTAGTIEGQKTWYDYDGKTNSAYEGTQVDALFVAQVLPDGTTRFTRSLRNGFGNVTNEVSTYSTP